MTDREALAALVASLPRCEVHDRDTQNPLCQEQAVARVTFVGGGRSLLCDPHATYAVQQWSANRVALPWAEALAAALVVLAPPRA